MSDKLCGYKCFYGKRQPIEVYAETILQARIQAGRLWNLKPSQERGITVVLCEKDDKPVTVHID
jgi:hypothetical protein